MCKGTGRRETGYMKGSIRAVDRKALLSAVEEGAIIYGDTKEIYTVE